MHRGDRQHYPQQPELISGLGVQLIIHVEQLFGAACQPLFGIRVCTRQQIAANAAISAT